MLSSDPSHSDKSSRAEHGARTPAPGTPIDNPLINAKLPNSPEQAPTYIEELPRQTLITSSELTFDGRRVSSQLLRHVLGDLKKVIEIFDTEQIRGAHFQHVFDEARGLEPGVFENSREVIEYFNAIPRKVIFQTINSWLEHLRSKKPTIPSSSEVQELRDACWHGKDLCRFAISLEYATAMALSRRSHIKWRFDNLVAKIMPQHASSPLHFNCVRFLSTELEQTADSLEEVAQKIRLSPQGSHEVFDRGVVERNILADPICGSLGLQVRNNAGNLESSLVADRQAADSSRIATLIIHAPDVNEVLGVAREAASALLAFREQKLNIEGLLYNISFRGFRQLAYHQRVLPKNGILWTSQASDVPIDLSCNRTMSTGDLQELGTSLVDASCVLRLAGLVQEFAFPKGEAREKLWEECVRPASRHAIPILKEQAQRFSRVWDEELAVGADLLQGTAEDLGSFISDRAENERLVPVNPFRFAQNMLARMARAQAEAELNGTT